MKIKFIHTAKPRKFEYKPRYYNPEQEAKERRRDELLGPKAGQQSDKEYVPGAIIRSRMGARHETMRERRKGRGKTLVLVIAIMALLAAAAWILITT